MRRSPAVKPRLPRTRCLRTSPSGRYQRRSTQPMAIPISATNWRIVSIGCRPRCPQGRPAVLGDKSPSMFWPVCGSAIVVKAPFSGAVDRLKRGALRACNSYFQADRSVTTLLLPSEY